MMFLLLSIAILLAGLGLAFLVQSAQRSLNGKDRALVLVIAAVFFGWAALCVWFAL